MYQEGCSSRCVLCGAQLGVGARLRSWSDTREPPAERGANPGVGLRETLQTLELAGREQNQPKFMFPFPFSMLQLKQIYERPILLFLHSVDLAVVTSVPIRRTRGVIVR